MQEAFDVVRRAIEDDSNIVITGGPGVVQHPTAALLIDWREGVAEPIQSLAQRRAPGLLPVARPTRTTSTVAAPALDSVGATPGRVWDDLHLVRGGMLLQVRPIVGEACQVVRLNIIQRIGQGHLAKAVVMSIRFSIGRDMHELRSGMLGAKRADEPVSKVLAVGQEALESNVT